MLCLNYCTIQILQVFGDDYDTKDGTCIRDYIHVNDLAEAHVLACERLGQKDESFMLNLGSEKGISVKNMVEEARRITGRPIPATDVARRPGDPAQLVASAAKAYSMLGWKARYSDIETLISSTWNAYKKFAK